MISLYGSLARTFKKKYKIDPRNIPISVSSGVELLKAMEANFIGFRQMFKKSGLYKVKRGCFVNGRNITEDELEMSFNEKIWHIIPMAAGCKKQGVVTFILGAVLVVVGAFLSVYGQAWATTIMGAGYSMMFGGVAQMLTNTPGVSDYADRENPEGRPSYLSSSPVNAVEPGLTLPVGYGDFWCGSITVSGGMKVAKI